MSLLTARFPWCRLVLPLAAGLAAAAPAVALEWKHSELAVSAQPGQAEVRAAFPFRNPGPKPVTLRDVATDCGCTTAALAKKTYAPGETGEIVVVFLLGDRLGVHEKAVYITTDEPGTAPTTLWLRVEIPETVLVEPRALFWSVGETPAEKFVLVRTTTPEGLRIDSLDCDDPAFAARCEALEGGKVWRVLVKPVATREVTRAVILVRAKAAGQVRTRLLYAIVK